MIPQPRAEAVEPRRESWWDVFVHGVRGTGGDPTKGPLVRAIVLLAVPMVLEMVMESLFAVVDIFFVSRLGDDAIAGVALTESLLTWVYMVALGLSIGVTAMVARRIGEGDPDGAARAAVQAVILGSAVALVIAVIGVTWSEGLLRLMGAEESTISVALPYTRLALGSNVVVILLFLLNAAFRGAGDAAIAMRVLWIGNAINIVLDPLFIFGVGPFPELGVQGAARGDHDRQGDGGAHSALRPVPAEREAAREARAPSRRNVDHGAHRAAVGDRHAAGVHRNRELGRSRAAHRRVRERSARGLRHRSADHPLRLAPGLGARQRRRHHGRPRPGGEGSRAG